MARRKSRSARKKLYSRSVRIALVIALCTGVAFTYVWLHIQTVAYGYKIRKEEERLKLYRERSDALKLKISRLKSPRRIERLLENGSGDFVIPDDRFIVRMNGQSRDKRLALMRRGADSRL